MSVLTPENVFRKYVTDGVPDSGEHDPVKAEIVQLFNMLLGTAAAGFYTVKTKAALTAITPDSEDFGGIVLNDPTASNNGYYYRDSAAWVRGRGFPDTFAKVALSGTGTAQTGSVDTGVNPSDIEVFFAVVTTPNTGPLDLSISGEALRDVVNVAGNELSEGEWTGVVMFFLNDDGKYQLINDAGAAAAAAQSATDAHEDRVAVEEGLADFNAKYLGAFADDTAATAAAGGAPITGAEYWNTTDGKRRTWDGSSWQDTSTTLNDGDVTEPKLARKLSARVGALFDTVADLIADETLTYSNVAEADIVEAQGFRYEVAASDATDHDVETAGGVKLYVLPNEDGSWSVPAFGSASDGVTDDYEPLNTAIQHAFSRGIDIVRLGNGKLAFGTTIAIPGPIGIVGQDGGPWQAGSTFPTSSLIWIGGAAPMFTSAKSQDVWRGFSIGNKGAATCFIKYTSGAIQHCFEDLSGDLPSGYTAFSDAIIYCDGPRFGYSLVWHCSFTGGIAPVFCKIVGLDDGIGVTPFVIGGRSIFGAHNNGGSDTIKIVEVIDCPVDGITFDKVTFNQFTAEMTALDNTASDYDIGFVSVSNCEFDSPAGTADDRYFRLQRVQNILWEGGHVQGGSSKDAMATLTNNCHMTLNGVYLISASGPLAEIDDTCRVKVGLNGINISNTRGLIGPISGEAASSGVNDYTWAAGANYILGQTDRADADVVHRFKVTGSDAWSLSFKHPISGYLIPGQILTLVISNTSGGAIAIPTVNSAIHLSGTMTMPANGKSRAWRFFFDGTNLIELRPDADVSN